MTRIVEEEHFRRDGQVVGKWPLRTECRGLARVLDSVDAMNPDPSIGHTYQVNKPGDLSINGVEIYHIELDGMQGKFEIGDNVVLHGSQKRIGPVRIPLSTAVYNVEKVGY